MGRGEAQAGAVAPHDQAALPSSFTPKAERQLAKLPRTVQEKIAARINELCSEPRPRGVVKLKGAEDTYRLRVGGYRVLYQVADDVLLVLVVRIGHRRDVYRD